MTVRLLLFALFFPFIPIFGEGLPLFWWKEGKFINFGDHLSVKIVERITGTTPPLCYHKKTSGQKKKLLAIGSVLYFANEGDVVWGSGINGKRLSPDDYVFCSLDIRAVRGPLSKQFLEEHFSIIVPEIYGDPALLFPYLFPEYKRNPNPKQDYIVIVHYLDAHFFNGINDPHIVFATQPWNEVVEAILDSKFVISSSLHGIVLAEAYGIPARLLRLSEKEPPFKFLDYYLGTGRSGFSPASTIEEALLMGGEPALRCDLEALYNAFPIEFWQGKLLPTYKFHKETP